MIYCRHMTTGYRYREVHFRGPLARMAEVVYADGTTGLVRAKMIEVVHE